MNKLLYALCALFLVCLIAACGNTRQLTYMQGSFDTARLSQINIKEPVIQKGDLLSIIIFSDNPLATAIYNQPLISAGGGSGITGGGGAGSTTGIPGSPSGGSGASPATGGYLVDDSGYIHMYGIGPLHVDGLTKGQLKDSLDARLDEAKGGTLKHPFYAIRFLNYRITLLGEINKPGIYTIPGEHVSLLEAIGMGGDLTFYGRRDNVLIIRQDSGRRHWARLDLTKPEIMASPYFYLQQNDVVVIEANKKKVAASDQVTARNLTIGATLLSTIAILYSIFK